MKPVAACLLAALFVSGLVRAADPTPEHWQPLARLIGTWSGTSATLVFESESFENFNNAWKARESYEFPSDDELVEVFELAPPGQPWRVYSRTRLERTSR